MAVGAVLTGRRTAEQADHWGGDIHGVPIFVLSHRPPDPSVANYPLVTYVSEGIVSAMAQAKAAAKGQNVMVHGAYTAQRALEAGVLDELQIDQIPVLFGAGRRLFERVAVARRAGDRSGDRHAGGHTHPLPRPSLTRSILSPIAADLGHVDESDRRAYVGQDWRRSNQMTTKRRSLLWSGFGAVVLFLAIGAGWIASLPPAPASAAAPPIAQAEADATLAALKPPKRERPLIAIIGINDATETTDYLMPYGILRRADVADVVALATEPGPVTLYPALKVEPQATVADFDARHPEGADYVIVPAMSRDDDPAALQWIEEPGGQGRDHRRRLRRSQGRRRRRAARRQAGDDSLVLSRASCATSIPRSAMSRTGGSWSTRALRRRRASPRPCRCRSR